MGFGIPLGSWLRGGLRDWAENLLSESALKNEGDFKVAQIRALWNDHQSQRVDHGYPLWNILMYLQWKKSLDRRNA
jgi:asparagine synthase (glutamine-hydrolysing)